MAKGLGIIAPATIWAVETTGEEPALVRFIQRSKCEELGWSELARIELVAAAGVRAGLVSRLWCTGEGAGGGYGFLVLH